MEHYYRRVLPVRRYREADELRRSFLLINVSMPTCDSQWPFVHFVSPSTATVLLMLGSFPCEFLPVSRTAKTYLKFMNLARIARLFGEGNIENQFFGPQSHLGFKRGILLLVSLCALYVHSVTFVHFGAARESDCSYIHRGGLVDKSYWTQYWWSLYYTLARVVYSTPPPP